MTISSLLVHALVVTGTAAHAAGGVAPQQPTQAPAAVERLASSIVQGRGRPTVTIPRIDAVIKVDGELDEDAWSHAARLGGFSQYRPVDNRPAEEQTEILVWYSPTALHFGIIAHDSEPSSIRATVADRDNLSQDDVVTIYLDTFNDHRRAFFFAVNPLGVQQDGVQSESGFNAGTMSGSSSMGSGNMSSGTTDLSPDYQYDSKGRLTADGYVVEVRIPFKSLRYDGNGPQTWGLNIHRKIQRTGHEDTWTDARRVSSFLAQSGAIGGLHDLKRGAVTELQPVITASGSGSMDSTTGNFSRGDTAWRPGFNARLGFTNLSLDATVKPDFSQVESDAGLVTINERFALFYAEKRPFFLEGIELFATPNQLVYTRQIAQPIAGGKLSGKIGKTTIAYLAAVDDLSEPDPSKPQTALFNIARIRRDLGADSTAGISYTDRTTSAGFNRVVAADSRIVFKKLYYVQGQLGGSWTDPGTGHVTASPIWMGEFDRTAPRWGFNYKVNAVGAGFETDSGYVPRTDMVDAHASNRFTWYGTRGATFESFTFFTNASRIWNYGGFGNEAAIEGSEGANLGAQLRGGWNINGSLGDGFVGFDRAHYAAYSVLAADGTPVPYDAPTGMRGDHTYSVSLTTPVFRTFNVSAGTQRNDVAIFDEASRGLETRHSVSANMRPSDKVRLEFSFVFSSITRARDGSQFARTMIPRLKVEYQPRRSLFFRIVGEYRAQRQDGLEDARTGAPMFVNDVLSVPTRVGSLRVDYLISYKPSPGTVAFIGYGSTLESPILSDRLADVRRVNDGFFVKLAYLFRR